MSYGDFSDRVDEIAVVGLAGRYPDSNNLDEFWEHLRQGHELISFFTDEELIAAGHDPAVIGDPNYVKAAALLKGVDQFDAGFFGFNPREAEILDPNHRFFLEACWEALENAGVNPDAYPGAISVYGGQAMNRYLLLNLLPNRAAVANVGELQVMMGNEKDFLTTRVSYKLNLKGASVNVQTACSTSLVAVHMATQALLNGECDMALAGGVSVIHPKTGYLYTKGSVMSPDGHCRAFDKDAQGSTQGSGVGVVVLKRIEDAIADGDTIYAVIKGSAVNNDGEQKVGYTAPSINGQSAAISEALAIANVEADTISYVETHGTATELGDPIEVAALTQVYRDATDEAKFCALGSVKTNVGHTDSAAGVTGLIKTIYQLKHKELVPSLHFHEPNPKFDDWDNGPFYVNTELKHWAAGDTPRRAGVSSFGIGGTNAHVVLEEFPERTSGPTKRKSQLVILSAKSERSLELMTDNLKDHLQQHPEQAFADVAHTLQVGRKAFNHRRALVAADAADAAQALATRDPRRLLSAVNEVENRQVAFLFPGVGDQYVNMVKELYETEPVFQEQLDVCFDKLQPLVGRNLRDVLFPAGAAAASAAPKQGIDLRQMLRRDASAPDAASQELTKTEYLHPTVFAVEYALAQLLIDWGITPSSLIGYSLGEYVAATVAGVFELDDALQLVAKRAQLIAKLPGGAMLAVPLSAEKVAPLLGADLQIATINTPEHLVVSGPEEAVAALELSLRAQGLSSIRVASTHAFHSKMMEPIAEEFQALIASFQIQAPEIPFISNVTGTWITEQEAVDPAYWAKHLCQTVRFAEGIAELAQDDALALIEVGPGTTLSSFALQAKGNLTALPTIRASYDGQSDTAFLLNTVANLWLSGVEVDFAKRNEQEDRLRVPLPTYGWDRQRYWIDGSAATVAAPTAVIETPQQADVLPPVAERFYTPVWKQALPLTAEDAAAGEAKRLLVLGDDTPFTAGLVSRLQAAGHAVQTLSSLTDFESRLTAESLPTHIVHLWSLTAAEPTFEEAQQSGLFSLLSIGKALAQLEPAERVELAVITNGLFGIESRDETLPAKATLLSPLRVLPQEVPNVGTRAYDILLPQPGSKAEARLLDALALDLQQQPDVRLTAYRGAQRWTQAYEKAALPEQPRLREGGVYLLAGLGLLGQSIAQAVAATPNVKLAIVTRTGAAGREEAVQKLQAAGADVLLLQGDVADADAMKQAVAATIAKWGVLHGVLHAAADAGPDTISVIAEASEADLGQHFQGRVHGLHALHAALEGMSLDFVFTASTLAAVLGGWGFVGPAAGHLYMDAWVAQINEDSDTPWITLGFDRLDEAEVRTALYRALSVDPVLPLVLSNQELNRSIEKFIHQGGASAAAVQTAGGSGARHPRPNLKNAYVEPGTELEEMIAEILQDLLGIEQIGIHDNFFQLGGNSLLGTQVVSRLRTTFQVDLPLRVLFEANTVADMAVVIEDIMIAELEAMSDEEIASLQEQN
ncbi:acyl transferase domain-containing protein [Tumebacillus sp. BK434]|uniref:type I polyketide synthase n=1 Tax=Tumebacillus sp. BK434 TaxID=2512169 RepID=UPI001049FE37|nr:type I polyketide synthase [Tumebacillus sp. BK434]TCP54506.1 acyl transferase domain-containing protein [Tumebacillus sp. BK434]